MRTRAHYDQTSSGFIAEQWPVLYSYLGDIAFSRLVLEEKNSDQAWVNHNLLLLLRNSSLTKHRPEILELANLEAALRTAFEAVDQTSRLSKNLQFHASAQLLKFQHNTSSIWSALTCGERVPRPHLLDSLQNIIVWRQDTNCRFRLLGQEEAEACELMLKGTTRDNLVSFLAATNLDATSVAKTYLRNWEDAKLLSAIPVDFEK